MEGPAHPGEVLVSVADGLGEGWVVGEECVHAGAGAGEEVVLLGGWRRLILRRRGGKQPAVLASCQRERTADGGTYRAVAAPAALAAPAAAAAGAAGALTRPPSSGE